LIRWRELLHRTGLTETSARRAIARGDLPAPVTIGPRCVAFNEADVDRFIAARIATEQGGA